MDVQKNERLQILLIDDDQDDYFLTRDLLADCSRYLGFDPRPTYTLDWVSSAEAGLAALQSGPPYDVYLIDYMLGPLKGSDLIKAAMKMGVKAPIIMMTGQGSYERDVEAMRLGAVDFLPKADLSPSLLERAIRYALDRKRTEEELERRVMERTRELEHANIDLLAEIAERRRVEAALQQERLRLFSLLDELPAAVYLQGPDRSIHFSNCTFQEHFGQAQGSSCYQLFHQRQEPCEVCPPLVSFQERLPVEWETRFANGRDYQIHNYPFTDIDGSPLILTLATDISRRKQIEAQLEQSNHDLLDLTASERTQRQIAEAIVQATQALNSSLDLEKVLDRILEQTQRVIPCLATAIILMDGEQARVARHRGFDDLKETASILSSNFHLEQIPIFAHMRNTQEPVLIADTEAMPEWRMLPGLSHIRSYAAAPLQADGKTIGFLNTMSDQPFFFEAQTPARLKAFAIHATLAIKNARLFEELQGALNQEQAMRERLIQSEKFAAMGRMVASVAHELNNPLQIIKNCLFLIKGEIPEESEYNEYLGIATNETQRLSNLVTELRELYRPHTPLRLTPVDLSAVLEGVQQILECQLQNGKVQWEQLKRPRKMMVAGVADQLKQVFLNLCSNGIEAMQPGGGRLSIRMQHSKVHHEIGVTIKDTGPGIRQEDLNKLYEPFFTTKPNGLGLGLSICFEIVERHQGRIEVKSQLGKGAAFTVWLPAPQI